MSAGALAALEAHVSLLETLGFDDDAPPAPDLAGVQLGIDELERAERLLDRLGRAEERLRGMQHRVRGELATARRPRFDVARPSPRVLDTSA